MADILPILAFAGSIVVGVTALFFIFQLLFMVPKAKADALHFGPSTNKDPNVEREKTTLKQILTGKVQNSFDQPRSDLVSLGLDLKKQKDGTYLMEPNGTYSKHAVIRSTTK